MVRQNGPRRLSAPLSFSARLNVSENAWERLYVPPQLSERALDTNHVCRELCNATVRALESGLNEVRNALPLLLQVSEPLPEVSNLAAQLGDLLFNLVLWVGLVVGEATHP
jgi:hypothetical protein